MSGAQIIVDPRQLEGAAQYLDAMAARARDMTPLMDAVGLYLVGATIENFEQESAPGGQPWKPSLRARVRGGQTLSDTGRLKSSITHHDTAHEVIVGTNVIYAAIHQFGGVIVPVSADALHFVLANGFRVTTQRVEMPARPYLGIAGEEIEEITDLARIYFEGGAPAS